MTNYGTDMIPGGALISGTDNLIMALRHRLLTPRGGLFYDPSYGTDLYEWLGEGISDGGAGLAVTVEMDVEDDPRVRTATATVVNLTLHSIELEVRVEPLVGKTFDLVISGDIAANAIYPGVEIQTRGEGG